MTYQVKDRIEEELTPVEQLPGLRESDDDVDVSCFVTPPRRITETRRRAVSVLGIRIPLGRWQRVRYLAR